MLFLVILRHASVGLDPSKADDLYEEKKLIFTHLENFSVESFSHVNAGVFK